MAQSRGIGKSEAENCSRAMITTPAAAIRRQALSRALFAQIMARISTPCRRRQ